MRVLLNELFDEPDFSHNGVWKWNSVLERMEKISSHTTLRNVFDCYVPPKGYYSDNLETFVESRAHKRRLLAERGLRETNDKLSKREI